MILEALIKSIMQIEDLVRNFADSAAALFVNNQLITVIVKEAVFLSTREYRLISIYPRQSVIHRLIN